MNSNTTRNNKSINLFVSVSFISLGVSNSDRACSISYKCLGNMKVRLQENT